MLLRRDGNQVCAFFFFLLWFLILHECTFIWKSLLYVWLVRVTKWKCISWPRWPSWSYNLVARRSFKVDRMGLPWWTSGQGSALHCRGHGLDPWLGNKDSTCCGATKPVHPYHWVHMLRDCVAQLESSQLLQLQSLCTPEPARHCWRAHTPQLLSLCLPQRVCTLQ